MPYTQHVTKFLTRTIGGRCPPWTLRLALVACLVLPPAVLYLAVVAVLPIASLLAGSL
jgi:hypothetical protein